MNLGEDWISWLVAKLEASGLPCTAQLVTWTSRQNQTTVTKGGSDIIPYGLADWDDGIIIVMASHQRRGPRIGLPLTKRHEGAMNDKKGMGRWVLLAYF